MGGPSNRCQLGYGISKFWWVVLCHPSQLYEFALEGILLFIIVWWFSSLATSHRCRSWQVFLVGYGVLRMVAEYFREPDTHLGFLAFDWLTMGQLLSIAYDTVWFFGYCGKRFIGIQLSYQ